ncbi:MAG TPA: SPASM domain-containing protein [Burkholderiales bacterium]|jgi:MoaA/NifB/PqqE/SkfB family radical SAM enzyme
METPLPSRIQIEPVGRGRSSMGAPAPALMSFAAYCRLLEQFPASSEIELSAPVDPLLHPRFFDMVRHAAAHGLRVSARSTLVSLSDRAAEDCVKSGLFRLQVALEPPRPRLANEIRVAVPFSRALRNVTRLVAMKRRLASAAPRLELLDIATRSKLAQLPELVRVARQHGADSVCVIDIAENAPATGLMRSFIECESLRGEALAVVEKSFAETRAVADALEIGLQLPSLQARQRCQRPWQGAYINVGGQATPCAMSQAPIGDMAREGVARVWNGDAYGAFRERLASDNPPSPCKGCALYR